MVLRTNVRDVSCDNADRCFEYLSAFQAASPSGASRVLPV